MPNTEITILNTQEVLDREFVIYGTVDEPLFLAKDVALMIDHANVTSMTNYIDEDEKVILQPPKDCLVGNFQPNTSYTFLTENGLYEVLMLSRKPKAKAFKSKVKEILKSIRKTGSYSIQTTPVDTIVFSSDPLERCKALTLVLEEERTKQATLTQQKEKAITERAMMQEAFSRAIVSDKDVGYTDFITRLKMTTQCACSLLKELNIFGKKGPLADFGEWFKTEPNKDGFPARFVTPLGQEKLIGLFNNNRDKMIAVNGTYRYLQPKNRVKQITLLPQS